jgi:serine-type D-Ala-D-Ala endopeptidase (penicillin-binding protein 7)
MNYFFKHLTLISIALGLVMTPVGSYAGTSGSTSKQKTSLKSKKTHTSIKRIKYSPSSKKIRARNSYSISNASPIINAADYDGTGSLILASSKALVINQNTNEVIYAKNTNTSTPIASVTKLMTAMVVLDAELDLDQTITISDEDKDYLKGTSSRLAVGTQLSRNELLHLALIASENRAASALATSYPGGKAKFVSDMNIKAMSLGMMNTHFEDSTGLTSNNVSTAEDLAKMVSAAYSYGLIREITTTGSYDVFLPNRRGITHFNNTNLLVRNNNSDWEIGLSKTGYISEAGRCLVMQAKLVGEPVIIVLLDSDGKYTRIGDANRVRKWVEHNVVSRVNQEPEEPITVGQVY